jgi:hypothetical protein
VLLIDKPITVVRFGLKKIDVRRLYLIPRGVYY